MGSAANTKAARLHGWISPEGTGSELIVLVHGLGGDADSPYMREFAATLQRLGHPTLRISMRGAGQSDPDYYHAGLGSDLVDLVHDPSLARYEQLFVIGFSLGGHISLHASLDPRFAERVAALATVCAPLDLVRGAEVLDAPAAWLYRRHILAGLSLIDARVTETRRRFRTLREFDSLAIVPRYGFDDVEHYWRSQSFGPRLPEITVPTLFVAAEHDPIVAAHTLRPHLERAAPALEVRWVTRGGHVGFPADLDLGMPGPRGLIHQVIAWRRGLLHDP